MLAGCAATTLMSGCSSSSHGAGVESEPSKQPSQSAMDPQLLDPLPNLQLPVQAYIETGEQAQAVAEAKRHMLNECLASMRIDYEFAPAAQDNAPSLMAGRYGPVNSGQARYGYHFMVVANGPAPQPPKQPPASATHAIATCSEKVTRKIPSLNSQGLTDEIKETSYVTSLRSREAGEAFEQWSRCMSRAGYSYKTPMDAMRDRRWNWKSNAPSRTEVAVAHKDVECKKRSAVVTAWFDAEAAVQQREIALKKRDLNAIKNRIQDRAEAARDVLAGRN
jgi:hypothetical protein